MTMTAGFSPFKQFSSTGITSLRFRLWGKAAVGHSSALELYPLSR